MALAEQRHGRNDLAGRAVAALEAVVLEERRLHRVQLVAFGQPFDRGDLAALVHHGERQAGVDAPAVDQHRAGAALAVVAALLGAGEAEVLAQRVEQRVRGSSVRRCAAPLTSRLTSSNPGGRAAWAEAGSQGERPLTSTVWSSSR